MFTGIVETTGRVGDVQDTPDGLRLRLQAPDIAPTLSRGESVAVDGACLTVETRDTDGFTVFLASETVDRTTLENRTPGDAVNLERAMPADGRFDGHLVQGHVDATTVLLGRERIGEDRVLTFRVPAGFGDHVVEKGSIALDGISLTVADRTSDRFEVAVIPTTWEETTLSEREVGAAVNVEIDVIAKYVASMLADRPEDR